MDNLPPSSAYRRISVLFFLLHFCLSASSQMMESFDDKDFTQNPVWTGDLDNFVVNENLQLQLNAGGAGNSSLVTLSNAIVDAEWEFFIAFDFNPSAQNFAKIYLTSDNANLSDDKNGYFILVGGSNDGISLFKEEGTESTKIVAGRSGILNNEENLCKIKAKRDSEGSWELWSAVGDTSQMVKEGEANDKSIMAASYFGILFQYTITRNQHFFFDGLRISGDFYRDTIPPQVTQITAVSKNSIVITLSEKILYSTPVAQDHFKVLPEMGHPRSVLPTDDSLKLNLLFDKQFQNGKDYKLEISYISDTAKNLTIFQEAFFTFHIPAVASFREVMINEIMVDPTPRVGLPEAEYIEIYNNNSQEFDLSGWSIRDEQNVGKLSGIFLLPEEFIILCSKADSSALNSYGKICVVSGMPSLNNDTDNLLLSDPSNKIIDQVHYTSDWYKSSIKNSGGYSLEIIDSKNPCSGEDNWKASTDLNGGTPGKENSVKAVKTDRKGPELISLFPTPDSLILTFNELLDPVSVNDARFYLNGELIKAIPSLDSPTLRVILNLPFQLTLGVTYNLEMRNIKDCIGNIIASNNITFGLPKVADRSDIVINEILFNPRIGGVDFVEIYNNTNKYIDLKNWKIANIEVEKESGLPIISNRKIVVDQNYLFGPKDFVALTTDIADIQKNYPDYKDRTILRLVGLPSFPNDAGNVILIDNENKVIDSVDYEEEFHSPILHDTDGVSLERISYDGPSEEANNWTSAASIVGFATPGAENSQSRAENRSTAKFNLAPKVIVPDNNGIDDYTLIEYQMGNQSYNGSVYVYDIHGIKICSIVENNTFSTSGFIKWEGTDDHGEPLKIGIYMVFIELYDLAGHIEGFKLPIAVGKSFR